MAYNNISKDELEKLYSRGRLSSRECAKAIGVSQGTILRHLKRYGIPTRPVSENGSKSKYVVHTPEWNKKVSEALKKNNSMKGKFWEQHHGYKDGISSYQRYLSRGFIPGYCDICKTTPDAHKLVVHHIDRNRHNNTLDNLRVLCHSCHRSLHIGSYYEN